MIQGDSNAGASIQPLTQEPIESAPVAGEIQEAPGSTRNSKPPRAGSHPGPTLAATPAHPPRRVAFQTLGCKLNQYETDSIAAEFERQGYRLVGFNEPADVYVINTCTVTNKADRKSRNTINQALRRARSLKPLKVQQPQGTESHDSALQLRTPEPNLAENLAGSIPARISPAPPPPVPRAAADLTTPAPTDQQHLTTEQHPTDQHHPTTGQQEPSSVRPAEAAPESLVVVTGCFVNSQRGGMESDGRTYLVDNQRKSYIVPLVEAHFRGELVDIQSLPKDLFRFTPQNQNLHTRGLLKIQDGCDNFCSFCIIPFVRGRAVSRPLPDILTEARRLLDQGYRELVLTGVNMSRYQWQDLEFTDVVEAVLNLEDRSQGDSDASGCPDFRVRISSIEPDQISPRFYQLLDHPRMTPHLHLCLQSGSERILLAMRRQYSYAEYLGIVQDLRSRIPDFNITTDLILGFPGEGPEEFQESLDAARKIGFGHIHTFPYSRRQGTRADRMPGQVSGPEKQHRAEAVRQISEESKAAYRRGFIGKTQEVLVEKVVHHRGQLIAQGLGQHYIPVQFPLPPGPASDPGASASQSGPDEAQIQGTKNRFFRVTITAIEDGEDPVLLGTAL